MASPHVLRKADFSPMKFITGATGLVGLRLMYDLLVDGHQLRALRRASSDMGIVKSVMDFHHQGDSTTLLSRVEWVEGDLLDVLSLRDGMQGCDEVMHCAAMVSFHPRDAEQMYEVNVQGTANVVDMALELGIDRLLHISSIAAIGGKSGEMPIDEKSKWTERDKLSPYALSKHASEMEVWRGAEEGLEATIVNPVLVLGPTDPNDSSGQLFLTAKQGMKWNTPGLNSYVDVRDVSRMSLDLMAMGGPTERFVLSAATIPTSEFYGMMSSLSANPPSKRTLRPWMTELLWRILWLKDLVFRTKSPVTKETARSVFSRYSFDATKVKTRLGREFIAPKTSLADLHPFYEQLNLS